jgi:hypothetical protein
MGSYPLGAAKDRDNIRLKGVMAMAAMKSFQTAILKISSQAITSRDRYDNYRRIL